MLFTLAALLSVTTLQKPFLLLYDLINKVGKDIMALPAASSVSLWRTEMK